MKRMQFQFDGAKALREVRRNNVEWRVDLGVCRAIQQAELTDLFRVVCALPKADARAFCKMVARKPVARSGLTLTNLARKFPC
ncbi:MAG: hypothetical protein HY298_20280 [Verrucomicrobia bacterium]|nr:hypothetical protein [Verrucomicrobiota bacterium]